MKTRGLIALALFSAAGCSGSHGPEGRPVDRLYDASYERFIAEAKGHKGGCEIELSAKGDGGEQGATLSTAIEVDDAGSYRIVREGTELVRVGSVTWRRPEEGAFERVELGARTDLIRDDAVAAFRDVLAPLRERLSLDRTGKRTVGSRKVEDYTLAGQAGGGADGGPVVQSLEGAVSLDVETGFPVAVSVKGAWEGPATPPGEGRVVWTVEKMECGITELGAVAAITPAIPPPTPTPSATPPPAPTKTPKTNKPKKKPGSSTR